MQEMGIANSVLDDAQKHGASRADIYTQSVSESVSSQASARMP